MEVQLTCDVLVFGVSGEVIDLPEHQAMALIETGRAEQRTEQRAKLPANDF